MADTDSMQENMTRLRMKMVQQKLANERERLQRPISTASSSNGGGQIKLQQAMIRRQELLDRIRQEQVREEQRPRTSSPRRRATPSSIAPPSRRSLPDLSRALSRAYYINIKDGKEPMAQTKHVIEHQFKQADPCLTQRTYILPPIHHHEHPPPPQITTIQPPPVIQQAPPQIIQQAPPEITTIQAPPQIIQQAPSVTILDGGVIKTKDGRFVNKSDFMDMMMMQDAQMHHMVMQQMMLYNLPGGYKPPTAAFPIAPMRPAVLPPPPPPPPAPAPPPVVHHYQSMPPLDIRGPPIPTRAYNSNLTFYDDGSNYFTYH